MSGRRQRLGRLARFVLRRLGRTALVLIPLIVITFFLTRALSDPVALILGGRASLGDREQLNHALGLDRPLLEQFWNYLVDMAHGDLGISVAQGQPAVDLIGNRLPASLLLAGSAMLLATVIGLTLGVLGGLRPGSLVDRLTIGVSAFSLAVPDFWLALVLIIVFAVNLHWFPTGGYAGFTEVSHLVLPAVTASLLPAGRLSRVVRDSVAEEMTKGYVVAARARGLRTAQILRRHVLKNVTVPTVTLVGYDFLLMFTGYIAAVEVVFGWPGLGRLAVEASLDQDTVLLSAIVVVTGAVVGVGNVVLDTFSAAVDRRMSE
jgi:peptide/nickel transport system permease protein